MALRTPVRRLSKMPTSQSCSRLTLRRHLALWRAKWARRHIGSSVVTRKGKLAGVFTATDAFRYRGDLLAPSDDDDDAA